MMEIDNYKVDADSQLLGGVAEWSKAPDSKSGVPLRGTVGSNPTPSAGDDAPMS